MNYYTNNLLPGVSEFSFKLTSNEEIRETLLSINSKATGVDGKSITMLLHCFSFILPTLTHLVNFCIETPTFPGVWKRATLVPLPKVSAPHNLTDLRPVRILPTISKVIEIILNNQMREYIFENNTVRVSTTP